MAWLSLRVPEEDSEAAGGPDEASRHRMYEAVEVQKLARHLFPGGAHASTAEDTARLLADPDCHTIFQARIETGVYSAMVHVLERGGDGRWHAVIVKTGFSPKSYVHEMAYNLMVLQIAGLEIAKATILLLSRDYRYGEPVEQLFAPLDCTKDALNLAAVFEAGSTVMTDALVAREEPEGVLARQCGSCDYFADRCLGKDTDHSIFELPSLHNSRLTYFAANRIVNLKDIPPDVILSGRQERVRNAALSGNTVFEPGLADAMEQVSWPCHYLDFETVTAALPLYPGNGCHTQLLTQFSIHRRENPQSEVGHAEFLADPARDCEREVAEALVGHLMQDGGTIFTYSNFERTCVKKLAARFPDLAGPLENIHGRMVDLLKMVSDYVYHPAFRGSYSIKQVLPALVPDLSYAGMPIADGSTAIMKFAQMARGAITGDFIAITRRQLLEYCKMDTLAMVRLHEVLASRVAQRAGGR